MSVLPNPNPFSAPRRSTDWDELVERLTHALAGPGSHTELRAMAREWCEEARRRRLAPEQVPAVLRSQIMRVSSPRPRGDSAGRRPAQVERLVGLCLQEYDRMGPAR